MRITRRMSLTLAVGSLIGFFILGVVLMQGRRSVSVVKVVESDQVADSLLVQQRQDLPEGEDARISLRGFHRSEVKDGRKVWEVKAKQGEYSPLNATAILSEATLWLYDKTGQVVELEAGSAKLHLEGAALLRADIYDGVKLVRNQEVTVVTDAATFDRLANTVVTKSPVQMVSAELDIAGVGMEVNLESREVRVLSEVESIIRPKQKGQARTR